MRERFEAKGLPLLKTIRGSISTLKAYLIQVHYGRNRYSAELDADDVENGRRIEPYQTLDNVKRKFLNKIKRHADAAFVQVLYRPKSNLVGENTQERQVDMSATKCAYMQCVINGGYRGKFLYQGKLGSPAEQDACQRYFMRLRPFVDDEGIELHELFRFENFETFGEHFRI